MKKANAESVIEEKDMEVIRAKKANTEGARMKKTDAEGMLAGRTEMGKALIECAPVERINEQKVFDLSLIMGGRIRV